jgi:hypothetical protein
MHSSSKKLADAHLHEEEKISPSLIRVFYSAVRHTEVPEFSVA